MRLWWRREAVLAVGGHTCETLAEDCDLALEMQAHGYDITQDDEAICYTEAPETAPALARQRFRWMYGNLQALWQHRGMLFNVRYRGLGIITLPFAAASVLFPALLLPFVYALLVVIALVQGMGAVVFYLTLFTVGQMITALVGVALAREHPAHLLIAPLDRFIYEPLRAYVVYRSVLTMLRGAKCGWNKVERMGTVTVDLTD